MPILQQEPQVYPPGLFDESNSPTCIVADRDFEGDSPPRWWCLHTKPRQEKATARFLHEERIAYFLPQAPHVSHTPGGRRIRSIQPLFPSYLFLYGDGDARLQAFQAQTLVQALEVRDQAVLERELRQIHRMASLGMSLRPEPSYAVGSKIRVLSGPLKGFTGCLVRRDNRDRFLAVVQFLGRGVSAEMEDWQVEPV